ncbi:MAG: response regulator transcription factor [Saprospiraceae bacterium]|nr:response regulator transcription factor [Saprospiraceae bacterium]
MNKATVLIVDDEPQIRKLLELSLTSHDMHVIQAEDGKSGLSMAANHHLGLPDMNGHEVLKALRLWYENAIIILSVQDGEDDIVKALDEGASDYLTKPFRNAELMARIRSAMKNNPSAVKSTFITSGNLFIDFAARTVRKGDQLLKLTSTEYQLLALLASNAGRVLTHQHILKTIWGLSYQKETQYLRVFIGTLRKKIEDDANQPKHLVTESRVGYRFQ